MFLQRDTVRHVVMGIIRDPAWQAVGVAVAIIIAFGLAWRGRRNKRLVYSLRSVELLSVDPTIRSDVQILYRSHPVQEVKLLEFSFENTGNVPILKGDFDRHISIAFGETARVLSVVIVGKRPAEIDVESAFTEPPLNPHADYGPTAVSLTAMLLNPADSFQLQCLVTGAKVPHVTGRIAGIGRIKQVSSDGRVPWWIPALVLTSAGLAFSAGAIIGQLIEGVGLGSLTTSIMFGAIVAMLMTAKHRKGSGDR